VAKGHWPKTIRKAGNRLFPFPKTLSLDLHK
jgi:hypothetical protein